MQHESLLSTGQMFTESEMLELAERTTSQPLIALPADSLVRILATQDEAPGLRAIALDCGSSLPESFANWHQDTFSWKTFQLSLHEELMRYSGRWPRSGMMQNGTAYRLPPLVRRISAIGSSLWRTPTVEDAQDREFARNSRGEPKLSAQAKYGKAARWPTPTTRDWRSGKGAKARKGHAQPLTDVIGGQLNPTWVEWLMGFPLGWTDLED